MRGQIDPAGYGKKKKWPPYSHGNLEPDGVPTQGQKNSVGDIRDTCSVSWFMVAYNLGQFVNKWTNLRDPIIAGNIQKDDRFESYKKDKEQVVEAIDFALEHCDLSTSERVQEGEADCFEAIAYSVETGEDVGDYQAFKFEKDPQRSYWLADNVLGDFAECLGVYFDDKWWDANKSFGLRHWRRSL